MHGITPLGTWAICMWYHRFEACAPELTACWFCREVCTNLQGVWIRNGGGVPLPKRVRDLGGPWPLRAPNPSLVVRRFRPPDYSLDGSFGGPVTLAIEGHPIRWWLPPYSHHLVLHWWLQKQEKGRGGASWFCKVEYERFFDLAAKEWFNHNPRGDLASPPSQMFALHLGPRMGIAGTGPGVKIPPLSTLLTLQARAQTLQPNFYTSCKTRCLLHPRSRVLGLRIEPHISR